MNPATDADRAELLEYASNNDETASLITHIVANHPHLHIFRAADKLWAALVADGPHVHTLWVAPAARSLGVAGAVVRAWRRKHGPLTIYNALPESITFWKHMGCRQHSELENVLVMH